MIWKVRATPDQYRILVHAKQLELFSYITLKFLILIYLSFIRLIIQKMSFIKNLSSITNLSSHNLTEEECKVLSRGLKFVPIWVFITPGWVGTPLILSEPWTPNSSFGITPSQNRHSSPRNPIQLGTPSNQPPCNPEFYFLPWKYSIEPHTSDL